MYRVGKAVEIKDYNKKKNNCCNRTATKLAQIAKACFCALSSQLHFDFVSPAPELGEVEELVDSGLFPITMTHPKFHDRAGIRTRA